MFTPLRYQATQADCYPTSVLNALIWLFERHELPGAILQHIYGYCLDGIERGLAGSYTSEHASLALVDWLEEFKTRSFAVATKIIKGRDLHLRPSSEVLRWLRRGGVAVLDVCDTTATTHSILALAEGADHLGFWDPYIRGARYDYGRAALRLETDGHSPNLGLRKSWLDSPRTRRYSFGPLANRVGVLIRRTKPGRRHFKCGTSNSRGWPGSPRYRDSPEVRTPKTSPSGGLDAPVQAYPVHIAPSLRKLAHEVDAMTPTLPSLCR